MGGSTIAGLPAYVFYERETGGGRGFVSPVYSVSGLIGPLHYTSGAAGEFDVFQHLNIGPDAIDGVACLATAGWELTRKAAVASAG